MQGKHFVNKRYTKLYIKFKIKGSKNSDDGFEVATSLRRDKGSLKTEESVCYKRVDDGPSYPPLRTLMSVTWIFLVFKNITILIMLVFFTLRCAANFF